MPERKRYYRKVITISAYDSPNVRGALAECGANSYEEYVEKKKAGTLLREPSNAILVPGVLSWGDFVKRMSTWDKVRKCVGIYGKFYEGAEVLMFPPDWLNLASERARRYTGWKRVAEGIGVDPAEGGDKTAMAAVDKYGVIEISSRPTPNTSVIPGDVKAFAKKHGIDQNRAKLIAFDKGGGGKQIADSMRMDGWNVTTIGFGEAPTALPRPQGVGYRERVDVSETMYAYVNRRAEMYHNLHILIDPYGKDTIFSIPEEYSELRRQLSPIPLWHDKEGRIYLPPKRKATGAKDRGILTLESILGCSPDEADSVVLGVHVMLHKVAKVKIGALR